MLNSVPMKKMVGSAQPRYMKCEEAALYQAALNECFLSPFQAEDEEDTIAAQEKVEGNVDHAEELDDLAKEGKFMFLIPSAESLVNCAAPNTDVRSSSCRHNSLDVLFFPRRQYECGRVAGEVQRGLFLRL